MALNAKNSVEVRPSSRIEKEETARLIQRKLSKPKAGKKLVVRLGRAS